MARRTQLAGPALAVALLLPLAPPAARAVEVPAEAAAANGQAEPPVRGELRLHRDTRSANPQGPLAEAHALAPAIGAPAADADTVELGLRGTLRHGAVSLLGDAVAWQQRLDDSTSGATWAGAGRINELNVSAERGAWAFSAGKKVLGWDVGHGFRPNDVVQQEQRRTLYATPLEGRPLLEVEHFGADDAATLVWVNPQRWHDPADATRNAGESALAGRLYQRSGALDAYGFARWGAHTQASLGAALAWVASDALELHASARLLQRHDGWQLSSNGPASANPWQTATRPGASQWLLGGQWTGTWQQSLLIEAWHDGTALPDAEWDAWRRRNAALAGSTLPPLARAAQLAAQASPFDSPSLRQDNLFVRLAWQPERWTASFDLLLQPQDRGMIATTSLQWQGDRWRLNAALRSCAGAATALVRQLPQRRMAVVGAALAF